MLNILHKSRIKKLISYASGREDMDLNEALKRHLNPRLEQMFSYIKAREVVGFRKAFENHFTSRKIFCISFQKTGTTSVGRFLLQCGFRVADWQVNWKNRWGRAWINGDYETVFSSRAFKRHNAFEDSPWWFPDCYKILYHRFPKAKFILLERDSDSWYRSMCRHAGGDVLGGAKVHCKLYRRETEYYEMLDAGKIDTDTENQRMAPKIMKITKMADHYKAIYERSNREVREFFSEFSPDSLFVGRLEDERIWGQLGEFLGFQIPAEYQIHVRTERKPKSVAPNS